MTRTYMCIDLKSFYASVECMERNLDPITTNLVVADESRTEKTICLAVSPALKAYGIPGRARLFEAIQKINEVNAKRRLALPNRQFTGKSCNDIELKKNPSLEVDFIRAKPRMAYYMKYSTDIYKIYLKYLSPEDILVYSIDEVFLDVTHYLSTYKLTPRELITKIIQDVYSQTGITATGGIGTNMYLAKIAMDIVAKHTEPDENGVRIAEIDEMSYRKYLWNHRPLTDFWRIGRGYAKKLEAHNLYTMGDIARCSINNEDLLYKLFGINAELLIDHAWGWEPCTLDEIGLYKPKNNSISSGQVLTCPYKYEKTKLIVKEMTELLSLDLVEKNLVTDQIVLTIIYDIENLTNPRIRSTYHGEIKEDSYGRPIPKNAHGTINLGEYTSSTKAIISKTMELFERIINKNLLCRKIYVVANHVVNEIALESQSGNEQLNLFTDYTKIEKENKNKQREKSLQKTVISLKHRYGKNAILRGINFEEGGTTIARNSQIGGHNA